MAVLPPLIPILHLWGCLAQDRPLDPSAGMWFGICPVRAQGSRTKGSKSLITCDWPASPSPWSVSLHSSAGQHSTALISLGPPSLQPPEEGWVFQVGFVCFEEALGQVLPQVPQDRAA